MVCSDSISRVNRASPPFNNLNDSRHLLHYTDTFNLKLQVFVGINTYAGTPASICDETSNSIVVTAEYQDGDLKHFWDASMGEFTKSVPSSSSRNDYPCAGVNRKGTSSETNGLH